MNLQAIFPAGVTELTVNGLHQWDYGRKLEIHADDLPVMLEVHFACPGMDKAIVRSCSAADGIAEAVIPDQCLEQNAPVVAWVFEVGATSGMTTKTITMPVIARAQPQPGATVPTETSDRYTEAIAAMLEAVEDVKSGNVLVARASYAELTNEASHAVEADTAEHAYTANSATKADHATTATNAERAEVAIGLANTHSHHVQLKLQFTSSPTCYGFFSLNLITWNPTVMEELSDLRSQTENLYSGNWIACSGAYYDASGEHYTAVALRFSGADYIYLKGVNSVGFPIESSVGYGVKYFTVESDTVIQL